MTRKVNGETKKTLRSTSLTVLFGVATLVAISFAIHACSQRENLRTHKEINIACAKHEGNMAVDRVAAGTASYFTVTCGDGTVKTVAD